MQNHVLQPLDQPVPGFPDLALSLGDTLRAADHLDITTVNNSCDGMKQFGMQFPMRVTTVFMVVVIEGSVSFGVNFQDIVAGDNSCVIISEGAIVEKMEYKQGTRLIFLSFSRDALLASASQNRLFSQQMLMMHLLPRHVEMLGSVYQMLGAIVGDDSFAANRKATVCSCLDLMVNIALQAFDGKAESADKISRQDEIVARFMQCVADNYRDHRDLGFYAEKLNLSLKYMSHVIYKQTGRHPSHWIRDHVILDAKTMLRSGRYNVQQVADKLNFPNQSFFGKYFKEAVGLSPKKWKSQ